MAIGKLQGVESVSVSLERASADIRLRPANVVTLAQLRQIVKDNGFSSRETTVTAVGTLIERSGAPALEISGLNVVWPLVRDPKKPQAYDDATARVKASRAGAVEVVGVVPASKDAKPDHIIVTSVRDATP